MKVLHVLESSIPDTGGYTIRALAIVEGQMRLGLDVAVVTSPLFPKGSPATSSESIGGVLYHRTNHIPTPAMASSKMGSYVYRLGMLHRYRRAVMRIVESERPDVIHAHSSYSNAYAAMPAARRFGIPLVYEVRTLWGESAVIEDGWRKNSWKHRAIWRLELGAMQRADAVVPIARGIYEELAGRGVDRNKMTIIPNGVDSSRFVPSRRDEERAREHGVSGRIVVGFIGSLRRLEGLSTLVHAFARCRAQRDDVALVIVGDGPDKPRLHALVSELGLDDVLLTGNVPHGDVPSWYSIMDILVYPRIRATINERVTPLKPLEAMALGKVCVGRDVGGLTELIENDKTGVIFPNGDPEALAQVLLDLMNRPEYRTRLGRAGTDFVRRERDWQAIIPRTEDLYRRLIRMKGKEQDDRAA